LTLRLNPKDTKSLSAQILSALTYQNMRLCGIGYGKTALEGLVEALRLNPNEARNYFKNVVQYEVQNT